jgi:hypothetical protein
MNKDAVANPDNPMSARTRERDYVRPRTDRMRAVASPDDNTRERFTATAQAERREAAHTTGGLGCHAHQFFKIPIIHCHLLPCRSRRITSRQCDWPMLAFCATLVVSPSGSPVQRLCCAWPVSVCMGGRSTAAAGSIEALSSAVITGVSE